MKTYLGYTSPPEVPDYTRTYQISTRASLHQNLAGHQVNFNGTSIERVLGKT